MEQKFLPVSRKDMEERGWDQVDFVYCDGRCLCGPPVVRARDHKPGPGS